MPFRIRLRGSTLSRYSSNLIPMFLLVLGFPWYTRLYAKKFPWFHLKIAKILLVLLVEEKNLLVPLKEEKCPWFHWQKKKQSWFYWFIKKYLWFDWWKLKISRFHWKQKIILGPDLMNNWARSTRKIDYSCIGDSRLVQFI